jgi:hypothetical protein
LFSSSRKHAYDPFARARLMSMDSVSCKAASIRGSSSFAARPLHSDPVAGALILPQLSFSLRPVFRAGVRMGSPIRAPALQEGGSLAGKLFST